MSWRKLANDPIHLSRYIKVIDQFRYVNCNVFTDADLFSKNISPHSKKHVKQFILKIARQIYPEVEDREIIKCEGSGSNQSRYIIYSWFVLVMLAAPSNYMPRSLTRELWIKHWFGSLIPNPSTPASAYSCNRDVQSPQVNPLTPTLVTRVPLLGPLPTLHVSEVRSHYPYAIFHLLYAKYYKF